jgi:hypothetical protein
MDAGSNDCAAVQTMAAMSQSGSSARVMRVDYSHRPVGLVRLVWLESAGDVRLRRLGTAEPGQAEPLEGSQNLGIGPVR